MPAETKGVKLTEGPKCPRCGCPGILRCTKQDWKSECDLGAKTKALLAGRSALAAHEGGQDNG